MCRQLGIVTLAEGVETAAEAAACRKLGFELMQGFYFGRPAEPVLVAPRQTSTNPPPSQTICLPVRPVSGR
jgi:EAL domain-containing protein (putative c-di-GMP-specific phosphodiesterase class I)